MYIVAQCAAACREGAAFDFASAKLDSSDVLHCAWAQLAGQLDQRYVNKSTGCSNSGALHTEVCEGPWRAAASQWTQVKMTALRPAIVPLDIANVKSEGESTVRDAMTTDSEAHTIQRLITSYTFTPI